MRFHLSLLGASVGIVLLVVSVHGQDWDWKGADYLAPTRDAFVRSFSGLSRAKLPGGILLYPRKSTILILRRRGQLPPTHPLFVEDADSADGRVVLVAQLPVGSSRYFVEFDEGPSTDPGFCLYSATDYRSAGCIPGEVLAVGPTGALTAYQRTNSYFPKRSTWQLAAGAVIEIKPAVYSVDVATVALEPLEVVDRPEGGNRVGVIPKGAPVRVVATDGEERRGWLSYSVRTESGLTGYVRVGGAQCPEASLRHFCWYGD